MKFLKFLSTDRANAIINMIMQSSIVLTFVASFITSRIMSISLMIPDIDKALQSITVSATTPPVTVQTYYAFTSSQFQFCIFVTMLISVLFVTISILLSVIHKKYRAAAFLAIIYIVQILALLIAIYMLSPLTKNMTYVMLVWSPMELALYLLGYVRFFL